MADYFVAAPAASNENAPAPAANGEAMDEIMVSDSLSKSRFVTRELTKD